MSADTTILIANFGQDYRVALVGAVENLCSPTYKERQDYLNACFRDKPVFDTVEKASWAAVELYDEIAAEGGEVEHGVTEVTLDSNLRVLSRQPGVKEASQPLYVDGRDAYLRERLELCLSEDDGDGEDEYPRELLKEIEFDYPG